MYDGPIAEAFARVVELALAAGAENLKEKPGCWEHQVDARWWVALNPHADPVDCSTGANVPPFCVYVTYNELPAATFWVHDGAFIVGSEVNEGTFIAAVVAAIEALEGEKP
jgi:hypothetical protein